MTAANPQTIQAQKARKAHGIPKEVYKAFRDQLCNARRRNIPMLFALPEWWAWWQEDNRWESRGLKGNGLVMARKGDAGPYSPENVYCASHAENMQDVDPDKRSMARREVEDRHREDPTFEHHLSIRGDGHPRSKAVVTPIGYFGSAALAADAYGISRQEAARRAKSGRKGWSLAPESCNMWHGHSFRVPE